LWTRGNVDADFAQNFALIIEVIDPLNGNDIYAEIVDQHNIYATTILGRVA
jgi:hypothetical protein